MRAASTAFRVARISPLLGRVLLEEDEQEGAPLVIVIGYDVWQTYFAGDPAVVGRSIQVDGVSHTVVGVMPEDFGFPVNHRFWTPLRSDPADDVRDQGPEVFVFARLARCGAFAIASRLGPGM